jgi:hypothetical protein
MNVAAKSIRVLWPNETELQLKGTYQGNELVKIYFVTPKPLIEGVGCRFMSLSSSDEGVTCKGDCDVAERESIGKYEIHSHLFQSIMDDGVKERMLEGQSKFH